MICRFDKDEWWPVFSFVEDDDWGDLVDVPEEFWERYQKVMDDFDALQADLVVLQRCVDRARKSGPDESWTPENIRDLWLRELAKKEAPAST